MKTSTHGYHFVICYRSLLTKNYALESLCFRRGYLLVVLTQFQSKFLPLSATALGEPWPPQQPFSIALCLSFSLSTTLSSLLSSLLQRHPSNSNEVFLSFISLLISCILPVIKIVQTFQVAIVKSDFQTSFIIICFICFSSFRGWLLGFGTNYYYGVGLSAPLPTPNLEDQGISFRLGHHPWPVWHRRPYQ